MATLKILWKEQQDMRRVQVAAVNKTLADLDGRTVRDWQSLSFQNLKDYVLVVFPEMHAQQHDLLMYYTDDDDEQVRITTDAELAEAFRLMEELASATRKGAVVVKITVVTKPRTQQAIEEDQRPVGQQEKKMMDLFIDLSKLIEQWDFGSADHAMLKRDLVSLLHEPGCQEALTEVMANPKFATLFLQVAEEFQKGGNLTLCLRAVASNGDFEEIARMLLLKCPQARMQIERVLQVIQEHRNVQMLSASDVFEPIFKEETKEDHGPIVAVFEEDVTCPDGTVLQPSQPFDKVWRIKNGGPKRWPIGCKLLCVGGDRMQAPDSVLIPSVQPGSTIDVSLRMTAPSKAGRYTGYWRLSTDDGTRFGQRMWVDINVVSPGSIGSEVRVAAPSPIVRQHFSGEHQFPTAVPVVAADVVGGNVKSADEIKWEAAIRALADMGFTENDRNIPLLEQHDGDLTAVISHLL